MKDQLAKIFWLMSSLALAIGLFKTIKRKGFSPWKNLPHFFKHSDLIQQIWVLAHSKKNSAILFH